MMVGASSTMTAVNGAEAKRGRSAASSATGGTPMARIRRYPASPPCGTVAATNPLNSAPPSVPEK